MKNLTEYLKIIAILFIVIITFNLKAQNWTCDTEEPAEDYLSQMGVTSYSNSFVQRNVNIFVHVIRRSNGTGGLTNSQIYNTLNVLSSDYSNANICFNEIGRNYIHDDFYFNFSSGNFASLINVFPQWNAINIYLLPVGITFGRASGIPAKAFVLGGNYVNTSVISHEMGHCLGLYHTHSRGGCNDTLNCTEAINGSNCADCGDSVCDTPADPCLLGNVAANCTYTGSFFNPLTNNIQSYTPPNCMTQFTNGQIARIHTMINTSPILQNVLNLYSCFNANCFNNLTFITPLSGFVDQEVNNWIEGTFNNVILPGADVTYDAGNQVRLKPGFKALSGSRFHAFIDGCRGNAKINGEVSGIDVIENDIALKIYPNPLSESATISYTLANEDEVTIYLFDATGKTVTTLAKNNQQTAGEHQLELEATNLPTGIYYLKLQSNETNIIKKLMIAK